MNFIKKAISLLISLSLFLSMTPATALASVIETDNKKTNDTLEKFPVTETNFGTGAIINGYYTYCIDKDSPWPKVGTEYYKVELPESITEKKDFLARALEGGYPIDAYGISKFSGTLPPLSMGGATQYVIWDIISGELKKTGEKQDFYIYMDALIDFVMNNNLTRLSSSDIKVKTSDIEYDSKENCTTGKITFSGKRLVILTYNTNDNNIILFDDTTEIKNGNEISSTKELNFKVFGSEPINLDFSYDDYDKVDPDSMVLYKTDDSYNGTTYQRMLGYKKTQVQGFASLTITPILGNSNNNPTLEPGNNLESNTENNSGNNSQNDMISEELETIEDYPIPLTMDAHNKEILYFLLLISGCLIAMLKSRKNFKK